MQYIIGESLIDGDETILEIIGGTIAAASTQGFTNDPCNGEEMVDLEHREEHYTRNPPDSPEKPYDDRSAVKKVLDDGIDVALETVSGGKRYYLKRIGPNKWTFIVLHEVTRGPKGVAKNMKNSFTDWFVKTFLTDEKNGKTFFDSKEEARNAIPEEVEELDC